MRMLQHPSWRASEEQAGLLRLVVASQTTEGHVYVAGERGHVKLCPLRRRSRGEGGYVKLCPSADAVTGSEQDRLLRAIDNALRQAQSATSSVP